MPNGEHWPIVFLQLGQKQKQSG